MTARMEKGITACLAVLFGVLGVFSCTATVAHAVEVQTHAFDATLSLTGECPPKPEAADPVPDPGCPDPVPHPGRFNLPRGVAIDQYGDIYVANTPGTEEGGEIDIFDAAGNYLTKIIDNRSPRALAIDSEGYLYVYRRGGKIAEEDIVRYNPKVYKPESGEIEYEATPTTVYEGFTGVNISIAVDTSSDPGHEDHLFINLATHVNEYGSAAEKTVSAPDGNPLITNTIGSGLNNSKGLAINPNTHDIYASSTPTGDPTGIPVVRVFDGEALGHPLIRTIGGDAGNPETEPSCPPQDHFTSVQAALSIAIEASNNHLFVYDGFGTGPKAVYEFDETGSECISRIEKGFKYLVATQIAIDNGAKSPNQGYLYVPSGASTSESHLWAFGLKELSEPPKVEEISAVEVTFTDAELRATINPGGAETHFTFEYTTQQSFEEEGFEGATLAGEGDIPAGKVGLPVSASVSGLAPGTTYRFRVVGTNECETAPLSECTAEDQGAFTTFATPTPMQPCANDVLRAELGLSADLPDCRAYELVSPADTGGRALFDPENSPEPSSPFGTPPAAASGESVAFLSRAGSLPGTEATGSRAGSVYRAERDPETGWGIESVGPSGTEGGAAHPGGLSPEHEYAVTGIGGFGSLTIEGVQTTTYVRYPDGSFHLLGDGSLADDPVARADYVAPAGAHIVFDSAVPLEADSPAKGVRGIYDRTPDETTHVVSLLPGGEAPAKNSSYRGASADGSVIAFKVGDSTIEVANSPLYLRVDNAETVQPTGAAATFAGLSADGRHAFYLEGGDLFRYDTESEETDEIASSGDATVVNVSADGSTVFFISSSILTGQPNPNGQTAQLGEENLYRSAGGTTEFIGTVTERDVEGEFTGGGGFQTDGLGLWVEAQAEGKTAIDPSRVNPSGSVFLFESRGDLTGYESEGKAQVYRYDATEPSLTCLSCNPTIVAASSDASLQTVAPEANGPVPTSRYAQIPNLTPDGKRAFFQTSDAILPTDTDGVQDVYEWEEEGKGSCPTAGGCLYLISSGKSANDNYLFGASESGDDVFIWTSDRLLERDADQTPSIYDARVGGGFPEPRFEGCEGEGCRPTLTPPPSLTPPSSTQTGPSGNVKQAKKPRRCPKGKHRAKRKGKVVCVRNHKKKHRSHRSRRAAR